MAVRITLKRSSILNKRPNADILDPGELALNTNALSPGLFFEAENNSVVKVGPTSVGTEPPTLFPSLGETYYNSVTRALSVGDIDPITASAVWRDIAVPYLGGSNGYVVFVAPEFPSSSDAIENDGQAAPFRTINRAALEISKQSITQLNESDASKNNQFTIIVAPGIIPVYNGPGLSAKSEETNVNKFSVNFEAKDKPSLPNPLTLQQFNSSTGGVLVPRGTSIVGMDMRKVELRPSYVPTYLNPTTGEGVNEPRSAVIKWTGNSLIQSLSFRDKPSVARIETIRTGLAGEGEFVSSRPHCFNYNDKVTFAWVPKADQRAINPSSAAITGGTYYVYPTGVDTFYLSFTPLNTQPNYVERSQLPAVPQDVGFLATCTWEPYSHNRLAALYPATLEELNEYYAKVQLAFPVTFVGQVNQAEVINPGETEIVAPVPNSYDLSLLSNSTDNASPYAFDISVRSNYGMCGVEQDGNLVTGFRSAILSQVNLCSLQKDPVAYELYTTVQDPVTLEQTTNWFPLQFATWLTIAPDKRPENPSLVTRQQQLELLNESDIINIRYYYKTLESTDKKSLGIPNLNNDFRHFGVRCAGQGYVQADSCWTIGTAVGLWAYGGGKITATGCSSNFGVNALRSEGFFEMGTDRSGSQTFAYDSGFTFAGIRVPEKLISEDTSSSFPLELGPNILSVENVVSSPDEELGAYTVQRITLGDGFQPINILPYSLAPGTGVYSKVGGLEYRAFFIDDGLPTVEIVPSGGVVLRVRAIDSTFPLGSISTNPDIKNWTPPFIRRWKDPRNLADSSYSLIIENSNPSHRRPETGSVLRLDHTDITAGQYVRPGVQLDPGTSGGWGRVFRVAVSEATYMANSPQLNEVMLNRGDGDRYFISLDLCDSAVPWVQTTDTAHGDYVTYNNRNWYAAANDQWKGVYFSPEFVDVSGEIKLPPPDFNSPWATSLSSEILVPVSETYQGTFAPDPRRMEYENGSYLRGSQPAEENFGFELYSNLDNGTSSLGLLRYDVNTGTLFSPGGEITPTQTVIPITGDFEKIPSPYRNYVVMAITNSQEPTRKEYVQVIGIKKDPQPDPPEPTDIETGSITVIRGLYGTSQDTDWPDGSILNLQKESINVLPEDYDFDWSPTKSSILRFFEVMGYGKEEMLPLLIPRERSFRNIPLSSFPLKPKNGFALATGAWPLSFTPSSTITAYGQNFHSVGRVTYSKGLPKYLKFEFSTKQYYDYLATVIWGGILYATGGDEYGNLPQAGRDTQLLTGRPVGTYTSEVTDFSRLNPGTSEGGGGGGASGISVIFTGEGLTGGPITQEGTISIVPPTSQTLGGVKAGEYITIDPDGVISTPARPGTVESITFTNGLSGGTITQTGTVSINTSEGLTVDANNDLRVVPPTLDTIGGVKQGAGITINPVGVISANYLGLTIKVLDQLSFNGGQTQFTLAVGGTPVVPIGPQYLLLVVGGIVQGTPANYSSSGSTLTFTAPPPAGASFYGIILG
jgi:hypothetical protein